MKLYYKDEYIRLFQGDCLEVMDRLIEKEVKFDAIITDPPYGTTACKWDAIIPFDDMWERLNKLIKENGAIVLFGSQPFTSELIHSNLEMYRYNWIWDKHIARGMHQAKYQPMRLHEDICIFSKQYPFNYYPIKIPRDKPITVKNYIKNSDGTTGKYKDNTKSYTYTDKNPVSIITGCWEANKGKLHPTQKPVSLMEYLINTYTNENELILDFTCGSGTTLLASRNLKRKCIGIELEEKYCEIAKNRLIA